MRLHEKMEERFKKYRRGREMTNDYGCTYVKTKRSAMPIVLGYVEVRARSVQMGQIVFMRVEGGPGGILCIC